MRYGKMRVDIFLDKDFCSLTDREQKLYFYLYFNPHGNMTGLFKLKSGYATDDLKIKKKIFLARMAAVTAKMPVKYDAENEVVWVTDYTTYNPVLMNEKQAKGLIKVITDFPNSPLTFEFLEILSIQVSKLLPEHLNKEAFKQLTKLVSKLHTEQLPNTVNRKQETEISKSVNPTDPDRPSASAHASHGIDRAKNNVKNDFQELAYDGPYIKLSKTDFNNLLKAFPLYKPGELRDRIEIIECYVSDDPDARLDENGDLRNSFFVIKGHLAKNPDPNAPPPWENQGADTAPESLSERFDGKYYTISEEVWERFFSYFPNVPPAQLRKDVIDFERHLDQNPNFYGKTANGRLRGYQWQIRGWLSKKYGRMIKTA